LEVVGTCGTWKRNACFVVVVYPAGVHLEVLPKNRRMILKRNLKSYERRAWTEFVWLRTGIIVGLLSAW
jgi:hypothetical protein